NLGPVAANGSRQVFPSQTTTYTLTAKSGATQDTRSVTIEVSSSVPPPPPRPSGPSVSPGEILGRGRDQAHSGRRPRLHHPDRGSLRRAGIGRVQPGAGRSPRHRGEGIFGA